MFRGPDWLLSIYKHQAADAMVYIARENVALGAPDHHDER